VCASGTSGNNADADTRHAQGAEKKPFEVDELLAYEDANHLSSSKRFDTPNVMRRVPLQEATPHPPREFERRSLNLFQPGCALSLLLLAPDYNTGAFR